LRSEELWDRENEYLSKKEREKIQDLYIKRRVAIGFGGWGKKIHHLKKRVFGNIFYI
jgi:hypothetical protein